MQVELRWQEYGSRGHQSLNYMEEKTECQETGDCKVVVDTW